MKKLVENKDWQAYLLIEIILIIISLIIPISPSKTGSDSSLADCFFDDPSYLEKVFFNFLLFHFLVLMIFIAYFLWKLNKKNSKKN